ncbi:MAG: ComEC family competence protein [Bacteroidales bacterium]|nr:ComEC family competence protein [Bacteroidales bacterium]
MDFVKNPFIAIFPPFAAGILFSILIPFNGDFIIVAIILSLFATIYINKKLSKQKPSLFGFSAYLFIFLTGIYTVNINKAETPKIDNSAEYVFEGIIIEPPQEKTKTIQCVVDVEAYKDSTEWKNFSTKSVVYFQKDSVSESFQYGDRIVFQGYLNEITNAGNPAEFNYKAFMQNKGIFATSYSKKGEFIILEHKLGNFFIRSALNLRNNLLEIYRNEGFQDQEFAVLSALTLGYRDEIDKETRQMFANTGAMHILAVSGLHVGIIFLILTTMLKFMDKNKKLRIIRAVIIILSLWIFAAIAGLSPSVSRSALMFSLFVIGKLLQRATSTYNIIFASAVILLFFNPLNLLSVGFQLSYAAVLSIVFFQPYIYKLFLFQKWLPDKIWALTSVSIAAQIGTMPIGLYYFHQFPNYFFLTNILVIPLASIILYLAVLLLIIATIVPFFAGFFSFLLKLSMKTLILGVNFIDKIPYSTTQGISISGIQIFILYAIIISFFLFWIYNRKNLIYLFLISSIFYLSLNIIDNYKIKTSNQLIIFNTKEALLLNVLKGDENIVITDTSEISNFNYSAKPYWIKTKSPEPTVFDLDSLNKIKYNSNLLRFNNNFFAIGNIKFLLLENSELLNNYAPQKIEVDYVILSKNAYIEIPELIELVDFKEIIFDGTNKYWRTEKWEEQCKNQNISCFDITKNGAFAVDFMTKKQLF